MKGLILSACIFSLYSLSTMVASHLLRPDRHARLFVSAIVICAPIYFSAYLFSPASIGFLTPAWIATYPWVDALWGFIVFCLNAHSYIDFFYGFNGGFSTSLMMALRRAGNEGAGTPELVARYRMPDGTDKIFAWRLPRLVEKGYVNFDPDRSTYAITARGRFVARLALMCKAILNLGKGG